ncbi:MAG TPA: hypothetical protein VNY27_09780 [Solirubrobacteraceae bacterium]|jgi:hypothetical protein|nr:hypothetical protein [Solirubrobacteraceae bacterium]
MSEFLASLKSDLLDRRFLPVLALLGVALLAALAYAVLGGGSSSSTPTPATPVTSASSGARGATGVVAISQASAANKAVSETTSGAHRQAGAPRDPFKPLPSTKAKSAATASSSTKSSSTTSSSSTSGSGKSTSSSGGTTPATPLKPIAPARRVFIHFHTTAQFGVVPAPVAGTPPQPVQLRTYKDMALDEPLPGKDNPQLVYLGVVLRTGKDAAFALTGAAILHGSATCKPSPTQCQAIVLGIGQTETLEVVDATGQSVMYELKLVSIDRSVSLSSASSASAHARASAKTGRALLRRAGLSLLPGWGYAIERGFVRSGK